MKVADLKPVTFGSLDGATEVEDSSFEDFQHNLLGEDEFREDCDAENTVGDSSFQPFPSRASKLEGTANMISPNKVMSFDDGFSSAVLEFAPLTPTGGGKSTPGGFDPFQEDPWEDVTRNQSLNSDEPEGRYIQPKVLFENIFDCPIQGIEKVDSWEKEFSGAQCKLDSHGFPACPSTSETTSGVKEGNKQPRQEQRQTMISDNPKSDDVSTIADQNSIRSRSTTWQASSEKKNHTFLGANCLPLPSCNDCNEAQSLIDNQNHEDNQCGTINSEQDPSHWERLTAKVPLGSRVKASLLQVRRSIMSCHDPSEPIVDLSALIGNSEKKNEGDVDFDFDAKSLYNESVKSWQQFSSTVSEKRNQANREFEKFDGKSIVNESVKSWQQFSSSVVSLSHEVMSIPSDAPTPRRRTVFGRSYGSNVSDTECDPTLKLCIDHYEQSAFQTLMSNLKGNLQIIELHIFRAWDGDAERSRTTEDLSLLFKTVRSLPNLQILNLANFLVEDIIFVELSQWKDENLTTIRIHVCKGALSERLLNILAGLPALKDLTLEMNESFPLHLLLYSSTLNSLTIVANDFTIDNLHAMELVQMLPNNKTLKSFTIEPPLMLRTFKFIASALRKNVGLEHLKFSLVPGNLGDTNNAICELALTLTTKTSLKTVYNINHSNIKVKDQTCDVVMRALTENFIIEDFVVFEEPPWFNNKKSRILNENKGVNDSIIPQIFNCAEEAGRSHCKGRNDGDANADNESGNGSIGDSITAIRDSIKSIAKSATSGVAGGLGMNTPKEGQ